MVPQWVFFSILPYQSLFGYMCHRLFQVPDLYFPLCCVCMVYTQCAHSQVWSWKIEMNEIKFSPVIFIFVENLTASESWVSLPCLHHTLDSLHGRVSCWVRDALYLRVSPRGAGWLWQDSMPLILSTMHGMHGGCSVRFYSIKE